MQHASVHSVQCGRSLFFQTYEQTSYFFWKISVPFCDLNNAHTPSAPPHGMTHVLGIWQHWLKVLK